MVLVFQTMLTFRNAAFYYDCSYNASSKSLLVVSILYITKGAYCPWNLTNFHDLQLTCLADLEFDYINPYDTASRVNAVILPEFITQGVLSFLFLLTGHWVMSLFSIPYLYYNVTL